MTNDINALRKAYCTYMACPTPRNYEALLDTIPALCDAAALASQPVQGAPQDSSMPTDMAQAKRWIVQLRARVDSLLAANNRPVQGEQKPVAEVRDSGLSGPVNVPLVLWEKLHDGTKLYTATHDAAARTKHLTHERDLALSAATHEAENANAWHRKAIALEAELGKLRAALAAGGGA